MCITVLHHANLVVFVWKRNELGTNCSAYFCVCLQATPMVASIVLCVTSRQEESVSMD